MTTTSRATSPLSVAALLLAATAAVAAGAATGWAGDARQRLRFGFAGLDPTLGTAGSIFATNARLLAAVLVAAVVVQPPRPPASAVRAALATLTRACCDTLLALTVALNVLLVGAALGAYGTSMLAAILPHGPLELAAFAPALALYLGARAARQTRRAILGVALWSTATLGLAAVLETYVAL